ncbi:MAG: indole-3-glycerol phosphate synthase TrpC [Bacteroidota bacterium]|nr:indole-3-glycerol phosphate synthase TrpC [Bacteroidota bacterium]
MNKLDEILAHKRKEVAEQKRTKPTAVLESALPSLPATRDFAAAVADHGFDDVSCIAEIKKASPSRGVITQSFVPEKIAIEYVRGGARAISILTDKAFFQGSPEYIKTVKRQVRIPILRKDFIIDEYQLYESRVLGADAILLIVSALQTEQLVHFISLAAKLRLGCLVECHSKDEIDCAVDCGAAIIGINNRDLKTFEVNLETSLNLKRFIPNHLLTISESGIRNVHHVSQLRQAGFDAILVGEQLMVQQDRTKALQQLLRLDVSV